MVTTTGTVPLTADNATNVPDADVSAVLWSKLADLDDLVADGQRGQALRRARGGCLTAPRAPHAPSWPTWSLRSSSGATTTGSRRSVEA
jgi:hypothetical protein